MDWDRKSVVLWLAEGDPQPTPNRFEHDGGAVNSDRAIDALRDVYMRQDDPLRPSTQPWMLWNDDTAFSLGQIYAVRSIFEDEVAVRRQQKTQMAGSDEADWPIAVA